MLKYEHNEQYLEDAAAIQAATNALSALVVGEGNGRLIAFQQDLIRIVGYYQPNEMMFELCLKMVVDITENDRISGLNCRRYEGFLAQMLKKCKSMRIFRRKGKKNCAMPKVHNQPCFCLKLAELKANQAQQHGDYQQVNFVKPEEVLNGAIQQLQLENI